MADNNQNKRSDQVSLRNDLFDAYRNMSDNETDQTIDNLNDELTALSLRDRENSFLRIRPFQDEAAALPLQNNIENAPIENEIDIRDKENGAIPKRFDSRFFVNSASDPGIRSPRYRSNFAKDLQNNRNSGRLSNFYNQNQNFTNRNPRNEQSARNNNDRSNFNNNNYVNRMQGTQNNNNINNAPINQSINDILQMAILIPNFDGTESNYENFEISCLDAAKILSLPNQKTFMRFIRDKFSGPIKLYIKVKLNGYENINQMLDDIKKNFMVRTPIHLLENKIYTFSQMADESVKEFGARLADLQSILQNRIKDKFRGNTMLSKTADVQKKIKKQFIQGLKRDMYVQFSLVDFRNLDLDEIIQMVAKNESRNKINENFDKSTKTVNFQQDNLNKTELVEALTIAISSNRSRSRERSNNARNYRDYSRENYNNRRDNNRNRSYSRDRRYNNSRDRDYSYSRRRNSNGYRDYSRDRHRSYSRNRESSYYDRENYYRKSDGSKYRPKKFSRDRRNSYDRKYGDKNDRSPSGDRKYSPDRKRHYERNEHDNNKKRQGDDRKIRIEKKRNSSSRDRDSDDSSEKNSE